MKLHQELDHPSIEFSGMLNRRYNLAWEPVGLIHQERAKSFSMHVKIYEALHHDVASLRRRLHHQSISHHDKRYLVWVSIVGYIAIAFFFIGR
jgi:hypothetical protein